MNYNFHIVEHKLFETDFFLDKIKQYNLTSQEFSEPEYYLSAFLSSSRSITFTMQYAFSKLPGFDKGYEIKQTMLRENSLATFFKEARNYSQKRGMTHLNMRSISNGEIHFFYIDRETYGFAPKEDMISSCEIYFKLIPQIFADFFNDFSEHINPLIYYSAENLEKRGQTIKDLELEVWGYNKWTGFGLSEEQTLAHIRDKMLYTNIPKLFEKYRIINNTDSGHYLADIVRLTNIITLQSPLQ